MFWWGWAVRAKELRSLVGSDFIQTRKLSMWKVLYVENAHMQISSKPVVQVCNDWNFDAHLKRRTNNFQVYVYSVYM